MPAVFPGRGSLVTCSSAVIAYVALGANLGNAMATVLTAVAALREIPSARVVAVSSLYRTAPLGLHHQPDFINAALALEVDPAVLPAPTLLGTLFAIEARFGRERSIPNAPRTLDLDLLLYGDEISADPFCTLPHPRMHERAFVLAPLAEIAPALLIPCHGPVSQLLADCADQQIVRL
jgi:2-amino-4-hydroxy-6-hydroxymethyldihydropteridine diphosphokinase